MKTVLSENTAENSPPQHGGGLVDASRRFCIPVSDWLDLSTGINPNAYPIPDIPLSYFHRLPEITDDVFQSAVRHYYECRHFAVANGSQPFIELLPRLRPSCNVLLPDVGYQEHAFHWKRYGHHVFYYNGFQPQRISEILGPKKIDVVVLINPCNPTAAMVAGKVLLTWREQLADRNGCLIVDEAFIDLTPEQSVAYASHLPGLIVLRSLGKFFGLAGLRIGFTMANESMTRQLSLAAGPWPISGPSHYVAAKALADRIWQKRCRVQLLENNEWMRATISERFRTRIYRLLSAGLFVSIEVRASDAEGIYFGLAQQGILIRRWPLPSQCDRALLRFGLIGSENETGRERFQQALSQINLAPVP